MSTPFFDPDDPRLTAYALGESTADERQAVEQLLATSPEARAAVEQTRVLARRLEEDFALENAAYQAAHPPSALPVNVIPFPGTPRRRGLSAAGLAWKVAAAFVVLGSLVWVVGRHPSPAPIATVPPVTRTQETTPTTGARPEPSANDEPLLAGAAKPEPQGGAVRLDSQPSAPLALAQEPPAAAPTSVDAPTVPETADQLLAAAPSQQARDGAPKLDEPPPAPGANRTASASLTAEAPLLAAARPAPPPAAPKAAPLPSTDDRLAAAVVRLRQPNGTFVGGVLLTADGRILAAASPLVADKPARTTAVLADGREFAARGSDRAGGTAFVFLRIDAEALSPVRLATQGPGDGSTLLVAHVDPRTGDAAFRRAVSKRASTETYVEGPASNGDFVFNAAGELLATQPAVSPAAAKSVGRARAVTRREISSPLLVRPFTAVERASLTRPPR